MAELHVKNVEPAQAADWRENGCACRHGARCGPGTLPNSRCGANEVMVLSVRGETVPRYVTGTKCF